MKLTTTTTTANLSIACEFLLVPNLSTCLSQTILFGSILQTTISTEIGFLTQIQAIYIGNKLLTGTIPSDLGNLGQLTAMDFSNNALTGTIPHTHWEI
jgi:hypothetical protein